MNYLLVLKKTKEETNVEKITRQFTINGKNVKVFFNWGLSKKSIAGLDCDDKAGKVDVKIHEIKVDDLPVKHNSKIARKAISYIKEDMIGYIMSFCTKAESRYPDAIQP
jgi:hypothetical protein